MGVEELAISIAEEKLHAAVQKAKSLEPTNREAAAQAYEEAAGYAERIAGLVRVGYNQSQARERAKRYRDHAATLRAPPPPPPPPRAVASAGKGGASGGEEKLDNAEKYLQLAGTFIAKADTKWDDIAGMEETKRLLKGMVFSAVAQPPPGVKLPPPSGILLYGPPGTGKTMLAAAAAGSFGATFLNVPASKLKDKYVGESGKILQAVFDYAEQHAPALIFFDDIDTVVTNRESGENNSVSRDLIGGLLTAMDGFKNKSKGARKLVLVFANTNQPWILDEALMSRFTQRVHVPLPDVTTRELILHKLIVESGYQTEHSIRELAEATDRFSGRELDNFRKAIVSEMVADANREAMERHMTVDEMRKAAMRVTAISREQVERVLAKMRPKTSQETLDRIAEWAHD